MHDHAAHSVCSPPPGVGARQQITARPPPRRFAPTLPTRAGLSHLGEHRGEEGIVPPCAFDFAAYGRGARMRAESIECQLAQNGEVLRSVVLAVAGAVLVEDDVE